MAADSLYVQTTSVQPSPPAGWRQAHDEAREVLRRTMRAAGVSPTVLAPFARDTRLPAELRDVFWDLGYDRQEDVVLITAAAAYADAETTVEYTTGPDGERQRVVLEIATSVDAEGFVTQDLKRNTCMVRRRQWQGRKRTFLQRPPSFVTLR